jgi:hypothetical protein
MTASAILLALWLWGNTYLQIKHLFWTHMSSEEFQIKVQDEIYRIKEIEKQKKHINKEKP